jgi:hypothetical protein
MNQNSVSINVTNAQNTDFVQGTAGSSGRLVEFNYSLPVSQAPVPSQAVSRPAPRSSR